MELDLAHLPVIVAAEEFDSFERLNACRDVDVGLPRFSDGPVVEFRGNDDRVNWVIVSQDVKLSPYSLPTESK